MSKTAEVSLFSRSCKLLGNSDWRRSHMSDLVSMFNFEKPDYSKVDLPSVSYPHSTDGHFDGVRECEETYGDLVIPTPPYGNQTEESALFQESGFKVRIPFDVDAGESASSHRA